MMAMKMMHNTAMTTNRTMKVTVMPSKSSSSFSSSVAPTLVGADYIKTVAVPFMVMWIQTENILNGTLQ